MARVARIYQTYNASLPRKDKIVLLNAGRRVQKCRPKNFIPEEDIRPLDATGS